jgi:lantibiotic modifying enzyme
VLGDLSLCHGELGIADVVLLVTPRLGRAWRRRADLILDAVQRHGPTCATPGGIVTPGLLHGLSGIGYGLLRLGFAETVPSVLLQEPTPGLWCAAPGPQTTTRIDDDRTTVSNRKL